MLSFFAYPARTTLRHAARHDYKQYVRGFTLPTESNKNGLLGFGRPLNAVPNRIYPLGPARSRLRFPNGLQDWCGEPLTLRERAMMAMMETIMGKEEWQRKVYDENICAKWRLEATGEDFSERMFDYCITELQENAHYLQKHGFAPVLDATAAVHAGDGWVSDDIREVLRRGAARLEDVADEYKDWHPGSGGKVLDLVHPSMYPLVYGRTRAVMETSDGSSSSPYRPWKCEIIPVPDEADCRLVKFYDIGQGKDTSCYSQKFQWLPCDVHFKGDGKMCIASYINNLHDRDNQDLYRAIESVIEKALPMWDQTLSSLERNDRDPRIKITKLELTESAKRPRPPEENEDDLDEDEKVDLDGMWEDEIYAIVPPEPGDYAARSRFQQARRTNGEAVDLRRDFAEQGLQIIVKLANIHLTPDKPTYDGGSWHIEGQLNEHICATALYYYDNFNITNSYLAFREGANSSTLEELPYEQSQYTWIEDFYGIKNDVDFVHELGHVLTKEGRLLTFPNVLQHRIEPFRLADPSTNGHRKILALFLVDPHLRIPSTSMVPPQQQEWWEKSIRPKSTADLPPEIVQQLSKIGRDALIELTEAKKLRLELMSERSAFVKEVETQHLTASTYFCEH